MTRALRSASRAVRSIMRLVLLGGVAALAFGEALDPDKLERLGRYEVHLDRKLERMLSMLIRLKDLRRATAVG